MRTGSMSDLDLIEELRLRRWARENYVPATQRLDNWHPIIQEEMSRKDEESYRGEIPDAYAIAKA
ncbi:MAG: hypothetical protein K8T89_22575 [Planctomycetes bacterium]|nr:hypothetical protein [Planctomycetota bacterium]